MLFTKKVSYDQYAGGGRTVFADRRQLPKTVNFLKLEGEGFLKIDKVIKR